jgi:hypothetical protein
MGETGKNGSWLKILVSLLVIVLVFLLPFLSGSTLWIVGKITFTWMQLFYGALSLALALAVYVWGVGNWSRSEPPPLPSAASTAQTTAPGEPRPTAPKGAN